MVLISCMLLLMMMTPWRVARPSLMTVRMGRCATRHMPLSRPLLPRLARRVLAMLASVRRLLRTSWWLCLLRAALGVLLRRLMLLHRQTLRSVGGQGEVRQKSRGRRAGRAYRRRTSVGCRLWLSPCGRISGIWVCLRMRCPLDDDVFCLERTTSLISLLLRVGCGLGSRLIL